MSGINTGILPCGVLPSDWPALAGTFLLLAPVALVILQWSYVVILLLLREPEHVIRKYDKKSQSYVVHKIRALVDRGRETLHVYASFITLVVFYYLIWRIEHAIGWRRPFDPAICHSPSVLYNDALNVNGAPDPLFITVYAFYTAMIYAEYKHFKRPLPWLFIIALALIFIANTVADFALSRATIGQFFTNVGVTVALTAGMFASVHFFFHMFPRYRTRLSSPANAGSLLPLPESVSQPRSL